MIEELIYLITLSTGFNPYSPYSPCNTWICNARYDMIYTKNITFYFRNIALFSALRSAHTISPLRALRTLLYTMRYAPFFFRSVSL